MSTITEDVLHLIFDAYVHDLQQSPTHLLGVCRNWQALVLAYPTLWTNLHIHVRTLDTIPNLLQETSHDGLRSDSPLRNYLARSIPLGKEKGLLLDIKIIWYRACQQVYGPPKYLDQMPELMLALYGKDGHASNDTFHVLRWRSLEIDVVDFPGVYDFPIDVLPGVSIPPSSNLETLVLRRAQISSRPFQEAQIRKLGIYNAQLQPLLPMHTVTSIAFQISGPNVFTPNSNLWERCTAVQDLEFIDCWVDLSQISESSLPQLRSLSAKECLPKVFHTFKPRFKSRALEVLTVTDSLFTVRKSLEWHADFMFQTLRLSSEPLRREFDHLQDDDRWRLEESWREDMRLILEEMDRRGIKVEGTDEFMEELIRSTRLRKDVSQSDRQ